MDDNKRPRLPGVRLRWALMQATNRIMAAAWTPHRVVLLDERGKASRGGLEHYAQCANLIEQNL